MVVQLGRLEGVKAARRTLHCDVVLVDKVRLHREPLGLREAAVVHDKLVQQPLQMRPSFEGKAKRSLHTATLRASGEYLERIVGSGGRAAERWWARRLDHRQFCVADARSLKSQ